jgi:hypothetical protein
MHGTVIQALKYLKAIIEMRQFMKYKIHLKAVVNISLR